MSESTPTPATQSTPEAARLCARGLARFATAGAAVVENLRLRLGRSQDANGNGVRKARSSSLDFEARTHACARAQASNDAMKFNFICSWLILCKQYYIVIEVDLNPDVNVWRGCSSIRQSQVYNSFHTSK